MIKEINGLHHVTSMASDAAENNEFFTEFLGLRRVKKTVNFDAPDVYHLYYGNERGDAGTVMTYFPFPNMAKGSAGAGEVGTTAFSVPEGSLDHWSSRLSEMGVDDMLQFQIFGENRLSFSGPDGDGFALVEVRDDNRAPWTGNEIHADVAIRGFHSASMRVQDGGASAELLKFMGYELFESSGDISRFVVPNGNGADFIDVETLPGSERAQQGAGSVHHIAFAVENREAQLAVRSALLDTGYQVTPVIDRDYFWAIYFRTPGGVLFEIATNEPGFDRDENISVLGQGLQLPTQHEHLRPQLEKTLPPLI